MGARAGPAAYLVVCPAHEWKGVRVTDATTYTTTVGEADAELDQRLSDGLDEINAAATEGIPAARELTVRITDKVGEIAAGISGWTWGTSAGIGMTWVRDDARRDGLGSALMEQFEREARERGARRIYVTSFTFQAPGFYERHGFVEFARWDGVPTEGSADVHLRKDL